MGAVGEGMLEEPELTSELAGLDAVLDIELLIDTTYLRSHRIDRDDQFVGDLLIGLTR